MESSLTDHHVLYAYFDFGKCVYIGITKSLRQFTRHSEHKSRSWWYMPHFTREILAEFPDRETARAAETDLIAHFSPVYNDRL